MNILLLLIGLPIILAMLYPIAIQYERGGLFRLLLPITIAALIIDVVLNYTTLAILTWDRPCKGEWTFSKRLKRLKTDAGWRGKAVAPIIKYLNRFAPDGNHV